ncbi:uncharacterized protein [Elaeis guineensis]|uniref:peptidyl-tRNA hydrolase n=1 Tax=Elaeis guineensis var. tenera TaxID=51953 RepID=A0A6I9QYS0_ELAGV|nr:peptidyl-tRNA hydrolase 2, mitochondrial [Elaeis guineensis]
MGSSVSLLAVSATLLIGAGCFALGYLLASASPPSPGGDHNKRRKTAGLRFLSWAQTVVSKASATAVAAAAAAETGDTERTRQKKPALLEIENLADILEDFKMVLVVRNDLKMGKGKIAAQCSHATLGLYKKLLHRAPKSLSRWEMCGQVKVALKIESEEDLLVLQERAKSLKLPTHVTIDAGRTQIAPNSRTVMAILGPADVVDDVTGGLKLL